MKSDNQIALAQLARLREESIRANKAYDAARKQWKAQRRTQARAQRPADPQPTGPLFAVLVGEAPARCG